MKILQINVVFKIGSTGKIVEDIDSYIRLQDSESMVLYGRGNKTPSSNYIKVSNNISFYFDVVMTRLTGLVGYFSIIPTIRAILEIKKFHPHIVHIHNLHGYYLNIPWLLTWLKREKIITLITTHDEFAYTGKCTYTYGCQRYEDSCGSCPELKDYPRTFFDNSKLQLRVKKKIYDNWNHLYFISPSEWLIKQTYQSIISNKPLILNKNTVDSKIFNVQINDFDSEFNVLGRYFLFVSNTLDDHRKGFQYVIELIRRYPLLKDKVIIIGSTENHEFKKNYRIMDRITNPYKLSAAYRNAHALLSFSKSESFGMVSAEAARCGTITIGFISGGIREAASHNSVFFDYGNETIYDYINNSLDEPKIIADNINSQKELSMEESYFKIYKEIVCYE
jgi:putative colanic acid biosynthesis glycosyltransferase